MLVGAYAADWPTANTDLGDGRLGVRRCFDKYLKAPAAADFTNTPAGVRSFYSCKAPQLGTGWDWDGVLAGTFDQQYADLFAALPPGTIYTFLHEPENDVSAQKFLALYQHLVPIFRQNAQPGVEIWTVGSHYFWGTPWSNKPYYVDDTEAAYYAQAAQLVDGAGLDVYSSNGLGYHTVQNDPGWQRWLALVGCLAPKVGIPERGITAEPGTLARRDLIVDDTAYMTSAGVAVVAYWQANQGGGAYDAYKVTDEPGKTAWQVLAARA